MDVTVNLKCHVSLQKFNQIQRNVLTCLADRPMSHPGFGAPVDELDHICKEYRSCAKCLKDTHGTDCIPEMKKYKFVLML